MASRKRHFVFELNILRACRLDARIEPVEQDGGEVHAQRRIH
jgi:hypothetical protein